MNHIQWLDFRPIWQLREYPVIDGILRIYETFEIEWMIHGRHHIAFPRTRARMAV